MAGNGVAKDTYSVHDLMTNDFQFREKEQQLLKAGRPKMPAPEVEGGSM